MKAIGVMGGTYDPIHYGHLVAAEGVRAFFHLDQVVFVPAGSPPHKQGRKISSAEARVAMAEMATVTNPKFAVSRIEVDRPGPSFTVDTMRSFRQMYGPETQLFFITGADAALEILTWQDPPALLNLCQVIAATRPGFALEGFKRLGEQLPLTRERIHTLEVPALAISSTDIRQRVKDGLPIKYLVPESVEHFILKHHLYTPEHA